MAGRIITDVFDIMMDAGGESETASERKNADEALIDCLNKYGFVDMEYLMAVTGLPAAKIAATLQGIIFQDPAAVMGHSRYDGTVGWVVSAKYFSGNIRKKLALAKEANQKFKGRFSTNIIALKNLLPHNLNIDDIHVSFGASWIPEEEYAEFMYEFFGFKEVPEVIFHKELKRWDIKLFGKDASSDANTITYGVVEDVPFGHKRKPKQYLTAVDIILQTLNAKTVKAYDYIPKRFNLKGQLEYDAVVNSVKTLEAQEKQKLIAKAFRDWIYSDKTRTENFEAYYNETLVGYAFSPYDGSFLKFPGLNPRVTLYSHQKNAIARVLLSGKNVVFSHDVGTGKTYEIVVSIHELYRLGLSLKNMVVVPNNILKDFEKAHRFLYPDDKIFVVYPKDFTPKKRAQTLATIRDGDFVAVYMAYSSFDMIVMSKQYYVKKYAEQINKLGRAAFHADSKSEQRALESKKKSLEKKLEKFIKEREEDLWITYDQLGITTLVLDEAHNYKNIPIQASADNIVGMSKSGSKKCAEMLEKAHNTDRLIFASGTILTNSLADLFTFQYYLQPRTLEAHGINTFDTWINTFGESETSFECDVDCNSKTLRTVTRFASFHNLSELMSLFSQVCDSHHISAAEEGLPEFSGYTDVIVPKNEYQTEYIKHLSERTELIHLKKVKRTVDNLLKVTGDGRKAALDIRLVDEYAFVELNAKTKISVCADNIAFVYFRHRDSAQIVFCDIGTPKASFNVYDALKTELVARGIQPHEIAFVHDATTESARAKLFEDMNLAKLKVVIGSTQKLGVGVNVQERLVALHHLSVPWKPSDMVQREGRILRKGNTSKNVSIYRYITEGTFDAYSWQLLENKQKFISDYLSGISCARTMEDIEGTVLNYAEVKALAIGNMLIKRRVEVSNLLERERIKSRSRQTQMQRLCALIETSIEEIDACEKLAAIALKDYDDYMKRKQSISNAEREDFGEALLYALAHNDFCSEDRLFDDYQGFDIVLPAQMDLEHPYVMIESGNGGRYFCDMSGDKTRMGCSKTIDYLISHLKKNADQLIESVSELKGRIAYAEEDLDKGNPYLEKIEELKCELETVDRLLEEELNEEVS